MNEIKAVKPLAACSNDSQLIRSYRCSYLVFKVYGQNESQESIFVIIWFYPDHR